MQSYAKLLPSSMQWVGGAVGLGFGIGPKLHRSMGHEHVPLRLHLIDLGVVHVKHAGLAASPFQRPDPKQHKDLQKGCSESLFQMDLRRVSLRGLFGGGAGALLLGLVSRQAFRRPRTAARRPGFGAWGARGARGAMRGRTARRRGGSAKGGCGRTRQQVRFM